MPAMDITDPNLHNEQIRILRARIASLSRSRSRSDDDPELVKARHDLSFWQLMREAYKRKPSLSAAQRRKIAAALTED